MELYLHIPFCRRKCRYCDFASYAGREDRIPGYISQVIGEAAQRAAELGPQPVETVFIGGGTPSLLPPAELARLLDGVFRFFPPSPDAEFTSEANPGTLTPAWLETAVSLGLNRLSLGMQAAQPELLALLGRIHSAAQVAESIRLARAAGIRNLSLDLMFGLPGQTPEQWRETLETALSLEPEHLSCYGLIPEEGTPLKAALDDGSLVLPDEEAERAMYDEAISMLAAAGYAQYEISNFARPGFACRHNLGYWRRVPYLGLGASAASFLPGPDGERRETNPPDLDGYARLVRGESARVTETVFPADAMFETMMLGLRLNEGVSESVFLARHGVPLRDVYGAKLETLAAQGLLRRDGDAWKLTRRGMDIQNSVLVELMDG